MPRCDFRGVRDAHPPRSNYSSGRAWCEPWRRGHTGLRRDHDWSVRRFAHEGARGAWPSELKRDPAELGGDARPRQGDPGLLAKAHGAPSRRSTRPTSRQSPAKPHRTRLHSRQSSAVHAPRRRRPRRAAANGSIRLGSLSPLGPFGSPSYAVPDVMSSCGAPKTAFVSPIRPFPKASRTPSSPTK